jgi:hypothetical protein
MVIGFTFHGYIFWFDFHGYKLKNSKMTCYDLYHTIQKGGIVSFAQA